MQPVSRLRQLEAEMYFDVIAEGGSQRRLQSRAFHNLGKMEYDDYARVSDLLIDADATGSFLCLGRDIDEYSETMAMLSDAGHEIVLHGYRHVATDDIEYDLVHKNISRGLDAIESGADVTPRGFVAPGQTVNAATLSACADLGLDWVLGQTNAHVPPEITFLKAVNPYDLVLLNEGLDPAATFDRIRDLTESGRVLFFHPNMLEYFGAFAEFEAWIGETSPVSVAELIVDDGVGMLCDAVRPLRIE